MNQPAAPANPKPKPKPTKPSNHHNSVRDRGLLGASTNGFSEGSGKLFPLNHSERLVLIKDRDLQMN
jgi:hypothetical protein